MVSITRGPSSEEVVWTSAEILHVEYRFVFTFFLHVSNWNRHPAQEDTLELESLKNSTHFLQYLGRTLQSRAKNICFGRMCGQLAFDKAPLYTMPRERLRRS